MPTPRATTRAPARPGSRTATRRRNAAAAEPEAEAVEPTGEPQATPEAGPAEQVLPEVAAEAPETEPASEPEPEADLEPVAALATEPTLEAVREAVESPADALIDTVTVSQQEAIETAEATRTAMFDGLGKVQREVAAFVADRIRQDIEAQRELMNCRSFEDLREVQSRFIRSTMEHYAAETTRLMALGRAFMTLPAGRP